MKQDENFRVRELVKKIESHPHRQDLQGDLQQSNAYNPFSKKSKKMIRDMGNVELFEICETIPKVQCSECLLYWNQGIVYCTCGHLFRENESSRRFHRWQLDILSIPNFVIKKVRLHGNRHGKTEAQKEHHLSSEEFERYKQTWFIFLNTSGRNAPMKLRSNFSEALTKMHRRHRESGEELLAPIPFYQY